MPAPAGKGTSLVALRWRHFLVAQPSAKYQPVAHASASAEALKSLAVSKGATAAPVFENPSRCDAVDVIKEAVGQCVAGDQLFLSFIGHGVTTTPTKQPFGAPQEFWVFGDGGLCDLDLLGLLSGLPEGSECVVLSDACRGGGMFGNWQHVLSADHPLIASSALDVDDVVLSNDSFPLEGIKIAPLVATLLLVAPVTAHKDTDMGFTQAFVETAGEETYRDHFALLRQNEKWEGLRALVLPNSAEDRVLASPPLQGFRAN